MNVSVKTLLRHFTEVTVGFPKGVMILFVKRETADVLFYVHFLLYGKRTNLIPLCWYPGQIKPTIAWNGRLPLEVSKKLCGFGLSVNQLFNTNVYT